MAVANHLYFKPHQQRNKKPILCKTSFFVCVALFFNTSGEFIWTIENFPLPVVSGLS